MTFSVYSVIKILHKFIWGAILCCALLPNVYASVEKFDAIIAKGDYKQAFTFLQSSNLSPLESAYCRGRFLCDLGARNNAILLLDSIVAHEFSNPTASYHLIFKAALVVIDALYEESQIEPYRKQCEQTQVFIDTYLSTDTLAHATLEAFWSRYYARNFELTYTFIHSCNALRLLRSKSLDDPSVIKARILALNGFRNGGIPENAEPFLSEIRNNRYKEAYKLCDYILAKKTAFNLNDARNLITLGNIMQDIGATVMGNLPADSLASAQKMHAKAVISFTKAREIAEQTIGPNNWFTSNASYILGLLAIYKKDYAQSAIYLFEAIERATLLTDTAHLLNSAQRSTAVKWCSWLGYMYNYIPKDSIAYRDILVPYFTQAIDQYIRLQLNDYLHSFSWLKDGYQNQPLKEYLHFLIYFDGWNERSIALARKSQAFQDYAASKFKLINRIMGSRFQVQSTALLKTEEGAKIEAEIAHLKSKGLWYNGLSTYQRKNFVPIDCGELEGYLKGNFFPNINEIQATLKPNEAYLDFSNISFNVGIKQFILIVLADTVIVQENFNTEKVRNFTITDTWKEDHYKASKEFQHISEGFWYAIDSVLYSKKVTTIRVCPNLFFSHLPFEALKNKAGITAIKRFNISYVIDLGIERLVQQLPQKKQKEFTAFHPDYIKNPLPHSKKLSNTLGNRYGTNLPQNITLAAFKSAMENYRVFHLGAHGSNLKTNGSILNLDTKNRDSTFIHFENEKYSLVQFKDVELSADLIVIAACESGGGSIQRGEGKIDFIRTFTQNGAKGVIAGLWELDDYATSKILEHFYLNLEKGEWCVKALRNAKLTFLEEETDPTYQHPTYWAGIVYVGEDQQIVLKPTTNYWWWLLVLPFSLLVYVMKRRFVH